MIEPGLPEWAVCGDAAHRGNLISSIFQDWAELERHNEKLSDKYRRMQRDEQRARQFRTDDAEILIVACNTPARTAKAAVESLRRDGLRVGLFQPISVWPFPIDALRPILERAPRVVVVEASDGQLEDELRLALSHVGVSGIDFHHVRHMGGILPDEHEVSEKVRDVMGVCR